MRIALAAAALILIVGGGVYFAVSRRTPSQIPSYAGISLPSVIVKELTPGLEGAIAFGPGRKAAVHYKAWIYDPALPANQGKLIAESPEDKPLVVEWGKSGIPVGWEQGMAGMRERAKRELVIPAELAVGKIGGKAVPEGAIVLLQAYVEKVD